MCRHDLVCGTDTPNRVLEVVAYEAQRIFVDRMVGNESIERLNNILLKSIQKYWDINVAEAIRSAYLKTLSLSFRIEKNAFSYCFLPTDVYYVSWGARRDIRHVAGAPLPALGAPLGKMTAEEFIAVVDRGLTAYGK